MYNVNQLTCLLANLHKYLNPCYLLLKIDPAMICRRLFKACGRRYYRPNIFLSFVRFYYIYIKNHFQERWPELSSYQLFQRARFFVTMENRYILFGHTVTSAFNHACSSLHVYRLHCRQVRMVKEFRNTLSLE